MQSGVGLYSETSVWIHGIHCSHSAALSGILTPAFWSSWYEAHFTSLFLEDWYNIKLCLFRQENPFLVNGSYLRVCAQKVIFLFHPVFTQFSSNTEQSQINFSRTVSVTKNPNVKDCSISDGAIQPFPSWASTVEICGKIYSLCKFPG